MDKTTKAFVISTCSVVTAALLVWIGLQLRQAYLFEQARMVRIRANEEQARQEQRRTPCSGRAFELFGVGPTAFDQSQASLGDLARRGRFMDRCMTSTAPVEWLE